MALPFIIFWVLAVIARSELGWRWTAAFISIWAALLAGFIYAAVSPYLFVAAQALLDCILLLIIFKGDIRIR